MLKELRKLDVTNRAKSNYIRALQVRGKLKRYITPQGYLAYETEEFKQYKATARKGRPLKETN